MDPDGDEMLEISANLMCTVLSVHNIYAQYYRYAESLTVSI